LTILPETKALLPWYHSNWYITYPLYGINININALPTNGGNPVRTYSPGNHDISPVFSRLLKGEFIICPARCFTPYNSSLKRLYRMLSLSLHLYIFLWNVIRNPGFCQ